MDDDDDGEGMYVYKGYRQLYIKDTDSWERKWVKCGEQEKAAEEKEDCKMLGARVILSLLINM